MELAGQVFRVLFEECTEAVFTVDRGTSRILTTNPRLAEMTGRATGGLVGLEVGEVLGVSVVDQPGLHEDVPILRVDGYPLFVALSVAHLGAEVAACIARDTTERRLLERELIEKHKALWAAHAELERRHRDLALMGARLEQASRRALIGELSAGVAHSLNNPLAALVSALRRIEAIVEEEGSPSLREQAARSMKRGRDAVARLEDIIRAMRTAHRSGATGASPRRVLLADEVGIALALFESRLGGIRVSVAIPADLAVTVTPGDLQQVLWNLIDNAILAQPGGGVLTLGGETTAQGVILSVEDRGPGVPESFRARLFEPFVSGRTSGTGLGLATARRLARDWGGDVRLAASAGPGACFEVQFGESHA